MPTHGKWISETDIQLLKPITPPTAFIRTLDGSRRRPQLLLDHAAEATHCMLQRYYVRKNRNAIAAISTAPSATLIRCCSRMLTRRLLVSTLDGSRLETTQTTAKNRNAIAAISTAPSATLIRCCSRMLTRRLLVSTLDGSRLETTQTTAHTAPPA